MRRLRALFLLLAMLLLPARGVLAVPGTPCPGGMAVSAAAHHVVARAGHHAVTRAGDGHAPCAESPGNAASSSVAGSLSAGSDAAMSVTIAHSACGHGADACNGCAALCSIPPLAGAVPELADPPAGNKPAFPALDTLAPSHIGDGLERPPRVA